jgi:hypothetical protein
MYFCRPYEKVPFCLCVVFSFMSLLCSSVAETATLEGRINCEGTMEATLLNGLTKDLGKAHESSRSSTTMNVT